MFRRGSKKRQKNIRKKRGGVWWRSRKKVHPNQPVSHTNTQLRSSRTNPNAIVMGTPVGRERGDTYTHIHRDLPEVTPPNTNLSTNQLSPFVPYSAYDVDVARFHEERQQFQDAYLRNLEHGYPTAKEVNYARPTGIINRIRHRIQQPQHQQTAFEREPHLHRTITPKRRHESYHSTHQTQGLLRPGTKTTRNSTQMQVGGRLANKWIIKNNRHSINYFKNHILTRYPDAESSNEYIDFMIDEVDTQPEEHYYLMELDDDGDWITGGAPKISNLINKNEEYILIDENSSAGKSTKKKRKKYKKRKKTRKKKGGDLLCATGMGIAAILYKKRKKKRKKKTKKRK